MDLRRVLFVAILLNLLLFIQTDVKNLTVCVFTLGSVYIKLASNISHMIGKISSHVALVMTDHQNTANFALVVGYMDLYVQFGFYYCCRSRAACSNRDCAGVLHVNTNSQYFTGFSGFSGLDMQHFCLHVLQPFDDILLNTIR